ncbi:hypothetical protein [Shimia sp.]|uniref:hypothetical protein n=1 Tax=Shimia sp. TaxID=1954381 RepID=UPI003298FCC5
MIRRVFKPVAIAMLVIAATQAVAFRSVNNQKVTPINQYEFEVLGQPGSRKNDFWCAIGDFFFRQRAPWQTRIYVKTGIGQGVTERSNNAVVFTLDPEASGVEIYTSNLILNELVEGRGRSLTASYDECDRYLLRYF